MAIRLGRSISLIIFFILLSLFMLLPGANAAEDSAAFYAEFEAANSTAYRVMSTLTGDITFSEALPPITGTVTLTGDITLSEALPPITGDITIEGGGHAISGDNRFRIFKVDGGNLTIRNLTLTEGSAPAANGGAVSLGADASLTVDNSSFRNNKAGWGGAIATTDASARLSVRDSSFTGNSAENSAGAIHLDGGIVNITDSSFVKNCVSFAFYALEEGRNSEQRSVDAKGCLQIKYVRSQIDASVQSDVDGGAIRLRNRAQVRIERSAFSENQATYGGAISIASDDIELSVDSSSFVGNRVSQSGGAIGGIWSGGGRVSISKSSFVKNSTMAHGGGAIAATLGSFDIANSTFSENYSGGDGGAVQFDEYAEVTITHATFVGNRSGSGADAISKVGGRARLRNSIIASSGGEEACVGAWERVANLSPDRTCAEIPGEDLLLGKLTGAPAYYPLQDRSLAVDAADPLFCLDTDQRGRPRPQDGGCDIGAIEARGAIAADPTPLPPQVCTLAEQIDAANRDQPAGSCPAGRGVDTISIDKDITLVSTLPAITSHIVIEGNGHKISGDRKFRIFDVNGGSLTVNNLTMADGRGGSGHGGAIRLRNGGRATVNDSRFINNSAGYGGGIYIHLVGTSSSWATVVGSSFVGNSGNAIYAGGGLVLVNSSSFVGNSGSYGVIQVLNPLRLDVSNSSFINNRSSAISAENGATATITHVTIEGSAIRMPQDSFTSAGIVKLRNSIISDRSAGSYCDKLTQNIGNLFEAADCPPALSGDPMLEEADDLAGYRDLMPGSPAINAAHAGFCPNIDQLGRARSIFGRCDIGAIEAIPVNQEVSECRVTTTHGLYFREGPGGAIIGGVAQNATFSALTRTPRWFKVEHQGASGWISADYVVTEGECG